MKDKRTRVLTDLDSLPEPDDLAEEIIENLEAGLNSFMPVLAGLQTFSYWKTERVVTAGISVSRIPAFVPLPRFPLGLVYPLASRSSASFHSFQTRLFLQSF
jgi:hypothetical protein